MAEALQPRPVRSFVRRQGRLTEAQRHALTTFWDQFGVNTGTGRLELETLFRRSATRILEIGFGDGESLLAMAQSQPEADYLGIEIHRPGVGHCLLRAHALGLDNVRVICADAVDVLQQLPDACLDRILVYFPDPWPKLRHRKRRLIQPAFVALLARTLKPGALLHLATDWEDYALHMLTVLEAADNFVNVAATGFTPRPAYRPLTKFERRGLQQGRNVWDLLFRRC